METTIVSTRFARIDGIFASDLDNEVVMAHLQTGKYYGLNAVGAQVWKMLAQPLTIDELCQQLLRDFAVDVATCHADVAELIVKLIDAQLVKQVIR